MYLNVIPAPPPPPLPSVRGLGQVRLVRPPYRRGMGQADGCTSYLQSQLAAYPPISETLDMLNTPGPSSFWAYLNLDPTNLPSGPAAAAQQVTEGLAQNYCGELQNDLSAGDTVAIPPSCTSGDCASEAYANFLAYFSQIPASAWGAGNVTPAQANPNNPNVSSGASYLGTVTTGGGNVPVKATLINTSRPGQSFQVGDSFQLTITGAPNSTVTEAQATQNGTVVGTGWSPGSTNSSGQLVITGTFAASDIGSWTEQWTVGSQPAGSTPAKLSFSIAAAPSGSGGGSTGGGSSSGGGSTGGGSSSGGGGGSSNSGGSNSTSTTAALPSWLTQDYAGIPAWGWGAGAVVLLMLFSGKR